jgi:hypothetical protein
MFIKVNKKNTILDISVFPLQTGLIYDVHFWGVRFQVTYNKFYVDWFWHSCNIYVSLLVLLTASVV